jgi:glycosyltransferase involved in cell wall biosynthesis
MIAGHDIVCLSCNFWHDHWGTPQHLLTRLAGNNRILVVDPPVSPLSFVSGLRGRSFVRGQIERWRRGRETVAPGLDVVAPPPLLPARYSRAGSRLNAALMRRWLRGQARQLGLERPIVWNFQPWLPGVASALDPSLTVYHCVDDFASIPYWWNASDDVRERDLECCREAGLVVCTGRALTASRSEANPNTRFVPNGADIELFGRALSPDTPVPPEMAALPGPVIGFQGVIDFRMDVELMAYLARSQPDWSIVLVGLVKGGADFAPLRELPNVHFLGWRPQQELPGYLKAMDVCLIPYVRSEHTHHMFPLKLFEYMAAGKPIVSTALRELLPYEGDLLTIGETPAEFRSAIHLVLAEDSPRRVEARLQAAAQNSWGRRAEQISDLFAEALDGSPVLQPSFRAEALSIRSKHGS